MNRPLRTLARLTAAVLPAALLAAGVAGCNHEVEAPKENVRWGDLGERKDLPPFLQGTVYARTELANDKPYVVSSYGLVGQLHGTGGSTAPSSVREYMMKELARRGFGSAHTGFSSITPQDVLRDKNYSIVVVEGEIPPGSRKGDWIDVRVSCLPSSNTTSLAHGRLFETDLKQAGARVENPGGSVNVFAKVKGPVMVNPAYALDGGTATGQVKTSLRTGVILYNGKVMQDRPVFLQLRHPSRQTARAIELRINERFQDLVDRKKGDSGPGLAEAQDEGVVEVYVPRAYRGDWEHFIGVVQHLWLDGSPEFSAAKAKELVAEAQKPDARLENISYCLEGLGPDVLPFVRPLLVDPRPEVAFAAARAAAFIGDPTGAADAALAQMARTPSHPFRLSAVQTLGALPSTSSLNHLIRGLLDADEATVRIEAYKVLARNRDPAVYTTVVAPANNPEDQKFVLDVVPSDGPPIVYATQRGAPRIALIGKPPELRLPVTFSALNNRFTISSTGRDRSVTLYYRDASDLTRAGAIGAVAGSFGVSADAPPGAEDRTPQGLRQPVSVVSQPDLAEIVQRLGGRGPATEPCLDLTYGEVVGVLQSMADKSMFAAVDAGNVWACSFVLQEPQRMQNVIDAAPVISASAAAPTPAAPAGRAEAASGAIVLPPRQ